MSLPIPFLNTCKALLGEKGWRMDEDARMAVSTPWRGTFRGHTPFLALPATTRQVSDLVKLCTAYGVAITPQGGNTGLVDGGTPHGELTVSMRRMNAIRNVDAFNNALTVEAGVPLVAVRNAASAINRLFPLSLGSEDTATIGGLISTNAGGVAVLRYGMMRDLLLGLEVVLPDGAIWNGLSGLRKNNTGYDLKHLFAGAEGTLGIITAATLKLFAQTLTVSAWISCSSAEKIVQLLALMRDHAGDTVTGFEMIPVDAIEMIQTEMPDIRDPCPSSRPWRVLCEISMARHNHAREVMETGLHAAIEAGLADDAVIAENLAHSRDFWAIREAIPLSKRAYGASCNHDIAVPVSKIPAFLKAAQNAVHVLIPDVTIIAFGHVGDGNLHYSVCESKHAETPVVAGKTDALTAVIHEQVLAFDGSISAEHGVGRLKRDVLAKTRPAVSTDIMCAIKQALDPQGLMNPDRVIRTHPVCD